MSAVNTQLATVDTRVYREYRRCNGIQSDTRGYRGYRGYNKIEERKRYVDVFLVKEGFV